MTPSKRQAWRYTLFEQVMLFSDLVVLLLIVPSSPAHMLFPLMHHTLGAPIGHTGYDAVRLPLRQRLSWATRSVGRLGRLRIPAHR